MCRFSDGVMVREEVAMIDHSIVLADKLEAALGVWVEDVLQGRSEASVKIIRDALLMFHVRILSQLMMQTLPPELHDATIQSEVARYHDVLRQTMATRRQRVHG
jgi:hypothetical protein